MRHLRLLPYLLVLEVVDERLKDVYWDPFRSDASKEFIVRCRRREHSRPDKAGESLVHVGVKGNRAAARRLDKLPERLHVQVGDLAATRAQA